MELTINGTRYNLSEKALNNSKYLKLHTQQDHGSVLKLKHEVCEVLDEDVSVLLSVLEGTAFVLSERIYVLYFLLKLLGCDNKIKDLDEFILNNIEDLRDLDIRIYLVKPELIWNLNCSEISNLLQYVDRGVISFAEIVKHTLSKNYESNMSPGFRQQCTVFPIFRQQSNVFPLFDFDNYIKYEDKDFSCVKYQAVPRFVRGDKILADKSVFEERLRQFTCGVLENFVWENVALMGGSLSLILNDNLKLEDYPYSDVDLFVVGSTLENREKTMNEILDYFYGYDNEARFYQCGSVVTILLKDIDRNFQIIDSGFTTLVEVAKGYDCGISQLWYQGDNKVLNSTAIGMLSLVHQVNPMLNNFGETSRLYKQYLRGYTTLLSPQIKYRKELLEDINLVPEILEQNDKVIKSLNKYIRFTSENTTEEIDSLMKSIYSPHYKLTREYKANGSSLWLNNYNEHWENDLINPDSLKLLVSGIKLTGRIDSDTGKHEMEKFNILPGEILPTLTDQNRLLIFYLSDNNRSPILINIGKNQFLGKCGVPGQNQIWLKLNQESRQKIDWLMEKYIDMVKTYIVKYYRGKLPTHRSLDRLYENKNNIYRNNLFVSIDNPLTLSKEEINSIDILLMVHITMKYDGTFYIVYKCHNSL